RCQGSGFPRFRRCQLHHGDRTGGRWRSDKPVAVSDGSRHMSSKRPPVIDAHHHFWAVRRGDYHWMTPDVPVLCRDYGPNDLEPYLRCYDIDATILVQAAQTVDETHYLLDIAART